MCIFPIVCYISIKSLKGIICLFACLLQSIKKKKGRIVPKAQQLATRWLVVWQKEQMRNRERRPEWHSVEMLEKRKQNELAFISSFGLGLWVSRLPPCKDLTLVILTTGAMSYFRSSKEDFVPGNPGFSLCLPPPPCPFAKLSKDKTKQNPSWV